MLQKEKGIKIMSKTHEPKTILVIEDEPDVRRFAVRVLELESYRVLQAEDGNTGLKMAQENDISLVLLDLRLPGIDGLEVLSRLKSQALLSNIPVVILTASAGEPEQGKAYNMGAANYLVKPISADDLKKAVVNAIKPKEKC